MHRIAAAPGGWNPEAEGVVAIEQTPAPIVFLTAADTEIQTLAQAIDQLPPDFPAVRVTNLLNLQQQFSIDDYGENVLGSAKAIVLRLLGGRAYWPYGLEVAKQIAEQTQVDLWVLPGDDRPDPELASHSTVPLAAADQLWRYFCEGGIENTINALKFIGNISLNLPGSIDSPQPIPRVGIYPFAASIDPDAPQVGVLFYRSHYLSGNTAAIDALCSALVDRHLQPVPIFLSSLREIEVQQALLQQFSSGNLAVLLNATSFSLAQIDGDAPDLWRSLDVPILQVILSGGTIEQWQDSTQGLSARDVAMNVALPEVDGRIITRAISFKAVQTRSSALETDVVVYEPVPDRVAFVADLAAAWAKLSNTVVSDRRIALILANYPTRDARLANGVGLDTPASCVELLKAMAEAGYTISNWPKDSDELIARLTATITNDAEGDWRKISQTLPRSIYADFFNSLPLAVQQAVLDRWGVPASEDLIVSGIQLDNVFVGVQPARGYDRDPSLNYHAPDLVPPHRYLAFYAWVRLQWQAQAIVHVGKHGNLEWLPGKSVALSENCFPEVAIGALPHLYPFIVNDPGEGSQAKRRAQAVIIDHLTPPMTRAELYGSLQQLENLIDEYYEAQSLDPTRLPLIRSSIISLIQQENFTSDLAISPDDWTNLLTRTDGYLCELKEAQIRDGLHILGQCPNDRQLRDLIIAIARHPSAGRLGLTRAIALDLGWDFDPLTAEPTEPFSDSLRTIGDAIAHLEDDAANLINHWLQSADTRHPTLDTLVDRELHWIATTLLPALRQTPQEITNLLHGLDGGYVPSGASGAPTRGRSEVLPTGRNFYSVDIRAIPTETAWSVGRAAAEAVIERYTQENGEYPRSIALSVWGTSTMRTGGDDIAEALALIGVQPIWDGSARRIIDFEILPLAVLQRPRVDVTLRISGFFRDAFPNLITLFHQAVQAVSTLDEPADQNPIAAQIRQDTEAWQAEGLTQEQAIDRAAYRIFGSKPGAYGAGLQGLIDAQNWTSEEDLARAYINWSSYAYSSGEGKAAPEAFEQRLRQLQIVLHNQDNREHDLLDSDDYYQFQGGLTVAVRSLTGQNPQTYFGDHALPENPKVRSLREEIARVYRSRVVNPKWIAGAMRHGYKGAFELAATVDYLFAYDATARCVEDFMYDGVAQAYLLDRSVQEFVQQKNPWALRDMAERLLEANQRGLWATASDQMLDQLRAIALEAEAGIETGLRP
ncbi:cobaltochelatase subunit CobN [Microcoleus sp. FACHB-1515]|uniref:cobaltochelatase subunit CobN n=1 Tax=Cyanophyceae TaxID=3028117 RepID=UPI0016828B5A|nr:cobaltochelatase subunit CobN [Microcoleus sp. FACHB-1515]MBD2092158.1 cobaltochelatase subunit CobN [Microcoleus sp. FACHB-1515]